MAKLPEGHIPLTLALLGKTLDIVGFHYRFLEPLSEEHPELDLRSAVVGIHNSAEDMGYALMAWSLDGTNLIDDEQFDLILKSISCGMGELKRRRNLYLRGGINVPRSMRNK